MAFAHASRVRLPDNAPLLLALATWLLYVADRLLDGIRLSRDNSLQERHYFHRRYRTAFLATAIPLLALLCWLVARYMDPAPRFEDMLLAAGAGLYLLLVHLPRRSHRLNIRIPRRFALKEAAVGVIFAVACIIPSWARTTMAHPWLVATGLLFAALCWLNCIAIDAWESPLPTDTAVGMAGRWLIISTLAVMVMEISMRQWPFVPLSLCVLLSTLLLLRLDQHRGRMAPVQLRALSDAVLLTPVLLLLLVHTR